MNQRTIAAAGAAVATVALLATASAAAAEDASPSPSPSVSVSTSASPAPSVSPEPTVTPDPEPAPEIHAMVMAMLASPAPELAMSMYFVDDVIVGDGPELTAADIDPDFAELLGGDMCGELEIDIDHAAGLVTVTGAGDGCAVSLASIMVFFLNGPVVEDVTLVSDGLFGGVDFFQEIDADWQFGFDAGWGDPAWFGLDYAGLPTASEIIGGTSVLSMTYGDTLIEDLDWGSGSEGPDIDDVIEEAVKSTAVAADAAAPAAASPDYTG